jgi:hypothetical protein
MATDPPPAQPPPPKAPSRLWKWTRRFGCFLLLLSFTCCGLICTGAWLLDYGVRNRNKEELDRVHVAGLRDGNVQAIYDRADAAFRKRYSLKDFQAFLEERSELLERDNLEGWSFWKTTRDGVEYVTVRSVPSRFSGDQWAIICKIVDGEYVLVGISPGMDELVPWSLRHSGRSSRRHH